MKILLKQLLVPTDFSNQSDVALTHAVALAEQFDASLRLLHFVCAPSSPWNWGAIPRDRRLCGGASNRRHRDGHSRPRWRQTPVARSVAEACGTWPGVRHRG
jgi:hypothetical protein